MTSFRQTRIKKNLKIRFDMIQAMRNFFARNGYIEVETPCRIPAPAPEAHIEPPASGDWFLRTSPELCMKRLLAAGYSRIFQIGRCFREKERGDNHVPEFTLLEWYEKGADYRDMMERCENLVLAAAQGAGVGDRLSRNGQDIDLSPPWDRLSVSRAFERFAGIGVEKALERGVFDEVMAADIEPRLGKKRPVFLFDYPAALGALARLRPDNPRVAERFELYIDGIELCNAFTELTDPCEQRARFQKEIQNREKQGKTVWPMPEKFLKDLALMPDASGNALGVDRLAMLMTHSRRVDDVTAFVPEEL
jgi:elongation factor P--(R)-beta-lysine ligase